MGNTAYFIQDDIDYYHSTLDKDDEGIPLTK